MNDADIDKQVIFYTSLYHACTVPNVASDVDGRYRGTDLQVHQLGEDDGLHYTVFSLWDTFRSITPTAFVDRARQNSGFREDHAQNV